MNHIFRLAGVLLPMAALMACGGGGGGGATASSTPRLETLPEFPIPTTARSLVGGQAAPNLTEAQINEGLRTRAAAANTLLLSDFVLVETRASGRTRVQDVPVTCSGGSCDDVTVNNVIFTFGLDEAGVAPTGYEGYNEESQTVMIDNGVTLFQGITAGRLPDDNNNAPSIPFTSQSYGGWLDGSVFSIGAEYIEGTAHYIAGSFGNNPGSNPSGTGSATWNGAMIGVNPSNGHVAQGDASIDIDDLSSPDVDVAFTNIKNLDTGGDIADMSWSNLTVTNGTFEATNGSIEGNFYGASHEEVGGVFDNANILGAFGGARQSP